MDPSDRPEDEQPTVVDTDGRTADRETGERDAAPSGGLRFRLRDLIGEGGMATVLEADDLNLERVVAIKRLKPELAADDELRGRFFDEARIIASLHHPGAVPVYDAGSLGEGDYFYAMERVRGKTLKELLAARGDQEILERSSILKYVDIFERVCETIAYAHSNDLIHRDLKPGNVMVDEYGAVFVMDWGLAKRLPRAGAEASARTQVGVLMGTPAYMSPEQARGLADAADCQTDVFALGAILYQILTGEPPFAGLGHAAVLKEVLHHDPTPPIVLNRRVGRELSAICMKALEKDPRKRYPSATELTDDIRRYRRFLPVSAVEPRLVDRVVQWTQRRPVMAAVIATLLVVAVGAAAGWGIQTFLQRRLLAEVLEKVESDRADMARLQEQIPELLARIDASADEQERRRLSAELEMLRSDMIDKWLEVQAMVNAVVGFTYPSPDRRFVAIGREELFGTLEWAEQTDNYALIRARARSALRSHERGNNLLDLSDQDLADLRAWLSEAEERLGIATAPRPTVPPGTRPGERPDR